MSHVDEVQVDYSEYGYTHTEFPNNIDTLYPKRAPYANELAYINQYNAYWARGDLTSANQVLSAHPEIVDAMIDLDFLLTIHHSQLALERFFREQVVQYIKDLQTAADLDMTEAEESFSEKVDNLYTQYETLADEKKTEVETAAQGAATSITDTLEQSSGTLQAAVTAFETYITSLVNYKGTYDNSTEYKKYDVVTYTTGETTCAYLVIVDQTIGNLPISANFVPITLKGDKGESGIGMTPRGIYNESTVYYLYDCVSYDKKLWYAKQNEFSGKLPSEGSAYWEIFTVISQSSYDITMADGSNLQTFFKNYEAQLNESYKNFETKISEDLEDITQNVNDQLKVVEETYAKKEDVETEINSLNTSYGELKTSVDNIRTQLGFLTVLSGAGAPTTATKGELRQYYKDTTTNRLYECEGTDATGKYIWTKLLRETDDCIPKEVFKFATSTTTAGYEKIANIDHRYLVIDVGDNNILKYYNPTAKAWKPITSVWS